MNDAARSAFADITGQHYSAVVVPEDVERVRRQIELKAAGAPATDYGSTSSLPMGAGTTPKSAPSRFEAPVSAQGCSASSVLKLHHERAPGGRI
jgi:hypothetical protein